MRNGLLPWGQVALIAALWSSQVNPTFAQESVQIGRVSPYRSMAMTTVTLRPTTAPGAVAEVGFDNRDVNGPEDDGAYPLSMPGLSVTVTFTWTSGADSIAVTVPDGFIAHLPVLTLDEAGFGAVLIFSAEGVGM